MRPFFSPNVKKVIFFDMNNTLVDRRKCFDSAFIQVLSEYTGRWEPEDIPWTPQDALMSYKLEWSRHRKMQIRAVETPEDLRQKCLLKALQPYPITVHSTFTKSFFEQVEHAEESYVALFPGVDEVLKDLSQRFTLAIISNGNRSHLEKNLQKLKLAEWIPRNRLFSSQKDGPRKPHPALFEAAMRATGITPAQGVMVGNSWKNDIVGSTRCGLDAVWIHHTQMKKVSHRKIGKQKVVIIRTFKQLLDIL